MESRSSSFSSRLPHPQRKKELLPQAIAACTTAHIKKMYLVHQSTFICAALNHNQRHLKVLCTISGTKPTALYAAVTVQQWLGSLGSSVVPERGHRWLPHWRRTTEGRVSNGRRKPTQAKDRLVSPLVRHSVYFEHLVELLREQLT